MLPLKVRDLLLPWAKTRLFVPKAFLWLAIALYWSGWVRAQAHGAGLLATGQLRNQPPSVRDSRNLTIEELATNALDPNKFAEIVLKGSPFGWTTSSPAPLRPGCDVLYVADPATAATWFANEWERGSVLYNWPSISSILRGPPAANATPPPLSVLAAIHQKVRKEVFIPNLLTDEAISSKLPGIQGSVEKHLRSWASAGAGTCIDVIKLLITDVIANTAMQMGLSPEETKEVADLLKPWNQGFVAQERSEVDPLFGKAMEARKQLKQRFLRVLFDPKLPKTSLLQPLKTVLAPNTEAIVTNMFLLFFGGFETVPSMICGLFWHFQQQPEVWKKVRNEHVAVLKKHGAKLSLAAITAMQYSTAAINETFRMSQVVPFSSRLATKDIESPGAPKVKAGCPFVMAWGVMSARDPAVVDDPAIFRPERWLDPRNIASLAEYQVPLGKGTHSCMGYRVARSTMLAVMREVALGYSFKAEDRPGFDEMPTGGRPINDLPMLLQPLKELAGVQLKQVEG